MKKVTKTKIETETKKQEDEVLKIQTELEIKIKENEELRDKMFRVAAEAENVKRRAQEDKEKTIKYSISSFAQDLMPTLENFYLAVDNLPKEEVEKNEKIKSFADGVVLIKNELTKVLEKNKISRIYPLDQKFDHDLHQAISQVESDKEDDMVLQVVQSGYMIEDRLLRPALVVVSKKV